MADRVEIRTLTDSDAELYWSVRLRALREHPDAFGTSYESARTMSIETVVDAFRTRWATDTSFVLGAIDDNNLVGTVSCFREQGPKEQHKAVIVAMYVVPEARGRGLGRALMIEAITRARAWPGVEQIHLSVVTSNTPARNLYTSLGFEVYGLERRALKIDGHYFDEEHMVLYLP